MESFEVSATGRMYEMMQTPINISPNPSGDEIRFKLKNAIQEASKFVLATAISAIFMRSFLVPASAMTLSAIASRVIVAKVSEEKTGYFDNLKAVVYKASKPGPFVKIALIAFTILLFPVAPIYAIGLGILSGVYHGVENSILKKDLSKNVSVFKVFNDELKDSFNRSFLVRKVKAVARFIGNPFGIFGSKAKKD